jgi:hypothetical protein
MAKADAEAPKTATPPLPAEGVSGSNIERAQRLIKERQGSAGQHAEVLAELREEVRTLRRDVDKLVRDVKELAAQPSKAPSKL